MKKILFLTGTRADFGKLKSLIQVVHDSMEFAYGIFATGMHLSEKHGLTVIEIEKCGFKNIHRFDNATSEATMDLTLAKTIEGFSRCIDNHRAEQNPATAHMFIINPLHAHAHDRLFSTHPSTAKRVAALEQLAQQSKISVRASSVPAIQRKRGS